jgi:hypothetical protein
MTKGLDKQIEEIVREAIEQWANSSDYYDQDEITEDVKYTSDKIKSVVAQAVQEALASQEAQIVERLEGKWF